MMDESKFWKRVDRSGGPKSCWPWTGAKNDKGYGYVLTPGGKTKGTGAHRIALGLARGLPLPDGLYACHRCDNPPCCNPAHLFIGTPQDNMDDKLRKGRHKSHGLAGSQLYNALLTEADVEEILRLIKKPGTQRAIAARFGVGESLISAIKHGRAWRHVPREVVS